MSSIQWVLGVGAQKAGTTWLADYYSKYPSVISPMLKEMHFFDQLFLSDFNVPVKRRFERELAKANSDQHIDELIDRIELSGCVEKYVAFYKKRQKEHSHFFDITPSYSMLDAVHFQYIKKKLGSVKFFFSMRNPADRVWSQLNMRNRLSFGKSQPKEHISTIMLDPMIMLRTNYARTVSAIVEAVGKENLFTFFYEDLFVELIGERTLRDLCSFVNLSYIPPDFTKMINYGRNSDLSEGDRKILIEQLADIYNDCLSLFGYEILPRSWKQDIAYLGL